MDANTRASRLDLLAHPVQFVTASEEITNWKNRRKHPTLLSDQLSGEQAKKIYEEIVSEKTAPKAQETIPVVRQNAASSRPRKRVREKKNNRTISDILTEQELFRAAQGGDLEKVKKCIVHGKISIGSTDAYSWTPLMMAAHGGHYEIVLFLLTEGAEWTEQIDGSGYDARDLACLGGHPEIVKLLMNTEQHIRKRKVQECEERIMKTIKREKLWCKICDCYYFAPVKMDSQDSHLSSTLHLISDKDSLPPCHSHFYIPGSNRGHQLLRKDGWDGESGLGPSGEGQKYPVKTVLKRDRLGFGADEGKAKARVTHFGANDRSAVKNKNGGDIPGIRQKHSEKTARKRYSLKKDAEVKQKEIDFRRLFH